MPFNTGNNSCRSLHFKELTLAPPVRPANEIFVVGCRFPCRVHVRHRRGNRHTGYIIRRTNTATTTVVAKDAAPFCSPGRSRPFCQAGTLGPRREASGQTINVSGRSKSAPCRNRCRLRSRRASGGRASRFPVRGTTRCARGICSLLHF